MKKEDFERAARILLDALGIQKDPAKETLIYFTIEDGTSRARWPWQKEEDVYPSPATHCSTCPFEDSAEFSDESKHHEKCEWRKCSKERREHFERSRKLLDLLVLGALMKALPADIPETP